jgi:hypothetical protein
VPWTLARVLRWAAIIMGVLGVLMSAVVVVAVGVTAYGVHSGLTDLARASIIVAFGLGSAVATVIMLGGLFLIGSLVAATFEQRSAQ